MHNRIRLLREKEKLSRVAFGKKLGVSGDVINNIERGRVEVKEHIIKLICSQFSVNEDWLRNGNEPMFLQTSDSIMEQLKEEFQLDDFSYNLVYEYLKLDEEKKRTIQEYVYNVLKIPQVTSKEQEQSTPTDRKHYDELSKEEKAKLYYKELELEEKVKEKSEASQNNILKSS